MEIYVARQPIFNKRLKVFGYELLYRRTINNFYEGTDDNQATAELINNAFLTMKVEELTGGARAFVNFSTELLIKEVPLLLPKETIVVEILERVEPTPEIINVCKNLKKKGYMLALDDFVFHEEFLPLIELTDIIKIEFPEVDYNRQRELINKFKPRVKFLAEKIETREEYQLALEMGYDLFQGYFFSKPVIVSGKEVPSLNTSLIHIVQELNQEEPKYDSITEVIEKDIGLTYKLLKMANSIYFGSKTPISSIKQALVRLGINEVKRWVYLLMLKEIQNVENKELIRTSLIRGKLMELLAIEMDMKHRQFEFFMTGMFSSIDILLNQNMETIIEELPLSCDVKEALLGKNNEFNEILNIILSCEKSDCDAIAQQERFQGVASKFMALYIEALKWVTNVEA